MIAPEDNAILIRKILIEILISVSEKQSSLKNARDKTGYARLPDKDRAYLTRLIALCLRNIQITDQALARFIHRKPQNKYLPILTAILRGAATEILFADTPVHAVTQIYLRRVKSDLKLKHTAGFIGGVLSAIIRHKAEILKDISPLQFLPAEFSRQLIADYSEATAGQIAEFLAQEAEIDLSPARAPVAEFAKLIDGFITDEFSFRIIKSGSPHHLPGFASGDFIVQSYTSSRAVAGAGDIREKKFLDLCAAPGGKTINAVFAGARVTACEISTLRGDLLKDTLTRTGAIEKTNLLIGEKAELSEKFDLVLLDAPCSATGTFRKNPDLFLNYTHKNIKDLLVLQKKLLEKAAEQTVASGLIIYAVCSLLKAEGEAQVIDFLAKRSDFRLIPPPRPEIFPAEAIYPENAETPGAVRLLPHFLAEKGGIDGFFIAYLRKEL